MNFLDEIHELQRKHAEDRKNEKVIRKLLEFKLAIDPAIDCLAETASQLSYLSKKKNEKADAYCHYRDMATDMLFESKKKENIE